jgi:hypothetical protein
MAMGQTRGSCVASQWRQDLDRIILKVIREFDTG